MSTEYTALPLIQQLQATLTDCPPYCSGVLQVTPENLELYYGREDARFINFLKASMSNDQSAVEGLAQACERAKFGRGGETVLDETYRKAGKMDSTNFKTGLDLENTRLLETVRLGLLPEATEPRVVRPELYKLNVYTYGIPIGEGAFFKPHKDTPRSQSMFASLVVILPTPHEGGALVLRHGDEEFTFDAAALLAGRTSSIAYIAFFSDVEHEVLPVRSGHRPPHASASVVKAALAALLDEPTFLPEGGVMGFRLCHDYPFPAAWTSNMSGPLGDLEEWLKGSDAVLFAACEALEVAPRLRLVSEGLDKEIALEEMVELDMFGEDMETVETRLCDYSYCRTDVLRSLVFTGDTGEPWTETETETRDEEDVREERYEKDKLTVHWITDGGNTGQVCSPYLTYGNEPSLNWLYMRVGLLVMVGPYGQRSKTEA
uniref:Oligopeptide transporter OPT-like protein n=1 Tax=Ganoderma boninense TaxID=34458 RepID=A0A5K1K7T1_9APHY|nr:Oligopeptide transporter OPT-like protein [Ganoderma boninense]